jgi:hypothetical protein
MGPTHEYKNPDSLILLTLRGIGGGGVNPFTQFYINPYGYYTRFSDPSESFVNWDGSTLPDDEYFLGFYFMEGAEDTWDLEITFEVSARVYTQRFNNVIQQNGNVLTQNDFYEAFQREVDQHDLGVAFV